MRSTMPMRSLRSSVLKWPDRHAVDEGLAAWVAREGPRHRGLLHLGLFGSYARGDAGVGSDIDLIAILEESSVPAGQRACDWDLLSLPLPAEILVYTREEWELLQHQGGRFASTLRREARWLWGGEPPA